MPIDESQLGNHPLKGGSVILDDEKCPKCDYNLKGLKRGGVCPECGRGISARKRGKRPLMIDAPRRYLRSLIAVLLLMGWAGIGAFAVAIVPAITFSLPILRATVLAEKISVIALAAGGVASLGWASGALLLCRRRPGFTESNPEDRRLVPFIAFTQPLWPVAFILAGIAMISDAQALFVVAYFCALVAGLGLVPTSLHISEYADWADDLNLAIKARTAGWVLGAGVIIDALHRLAVATDFFLSFLILIAWVFALIALAGAWYLLSWRCIQLAGDARWAIINAKDADARAARIAEKANREKQDQDRKAEAQRRALEPTAADTADLPVRLETPSEPPAPQTADEPEDDDDPAPYRLEDP